MFVRATNGQTFNGAGNWAKGFIRTPASLSAQNSVCLALAHIMFIIMFLGILQDSLRVTHGVPCHLGFRDLESNESPNDLCQTPGLDVRSKSLVERFELFETLPEKLLFPHSYRCFAKEESGHFPVRISPSVGQILCSLFPDELPSRHCHRCILPGYLSSTSSLEKSIRNNESQ
jgi:hypothetical protein